MPAFPYFGIYPPGGAPGLVIDTKDPTGACPIVSWRYSDGRSSPLDPMAAPTLDLVLDNADNRFNLNTAAPLIAPGGSVVVTPYVYTSRAAFAPTVPGPNGTAILAFTIDRVDAAHGRGRDSTVAVTCSSGIAAMRQATLVAGASWTGPADPVTFLHDALLAVSNPGVRTVSGDALAEPTIAAGGTFNQDNFWDVAASIAKSFGAVIYPVNGNVVSGVYLPDLRYVSRRARVVNGASNWASFPVELGDAATAMPVEGGDIVLTLDADLVRNRVTYETTLLAAATVTSNDTASQALYGVREETLQGPWTGADATAATQRLLERYAEPTLSVPPIAVNLDFASPTMAAAIFAEPYWAEVLVGVRAIAPGGDTIYVGCLLEGRDVTGTADGPTIATLTLTPCARDGFALYDTAAGGGYDTGRMGV